MILRGSCCEYEPSALSSEPFLTPDPGRAIGRFGNAFKRRGADATGSPLYGAG
jgi:hypothetical protein